MKSLYDLALRLQQRSAGESGQTLVEYALIIALMAIALVAVMMNFGGGVTGLYGVIQKLLEAIASRG